MDIHYNDIESGVRLATAARDGIDDEAGMDAPVTHEVRRIQRVNAVLQFLSNHLYVALLSLTMIVGIVVTLALTHALEGTFEFLELRTALCILAIALILPLLPDSVLAIRHMAGRAESLLLDVPRKVSQVLRQDMHTQAASILRDIKAELPSLLREAVHESLASLANLEDVMSAKLSGVEERIIGIGKEIPDDILKEIRELRQMLTPSIQHAEDVLSRAHFPAQNGAHRDKSASSGCFGKKG